MTGLDTDTDLSWLRVLLVHAHPDDETILTGGTIATLSAAGAQVTNLTCTLGEEGEVIGQTWQGLVAGQADQLGGWRAGELVAALAELGINAPLFLGGAGRWRDSGMAGAPSAFHRRAFTGGGSVAGAAESEEQVRLLAEHIGALRPQLVITYDPVGWYGHPDHIHTHDITHRALQRAAPQWIVPRVAWVVVPLSAIEAEHAAADLAATLPPHSPLRPAAVGELPGWPDHELTHHVPIDKPAQAARARALACHSTQVQLYPPLDQQSPTHFALSNGVLQPLLSAEYYVAMDATIAATKAPVGDDGPAATATWTQQPPGHDPVTLAPTPRAEPLPLLWAGLETSR